MNSEYRLNINGDIPQRVCPGCGGTITGFGLRNPHAGNCPAEAERLERNDRVDAARRIRLGLPAR